jgi:selenocysteine lyase/cysteine desulfurase
MKYLQVKRQIKEIYQIAQADRSSACHYNTPEEIELFLKATASFA